jgi:hypothetical protein
MNIRFLLIPLGLLLCAGVLLCLGALGAVELATVDQCGASYFCDVPETAEVRPLDSDALLRAEQRVGQR